MSRPAYKTIVDQLAEQVQYDPERLTDAVAARFGTNWLVTRAQAYARSVHVDRNRFRRKNNG